MIIQELIAAKVAQMDSNGDAFSFQHSGKDWLNLQADEKLYPAVFLDMPVKVTPVILRGGGLEERYQCIIHFLYKSELDSNPADQYATLKLAHAAMLQFILIVNADTDNFDTDRNVFGQAFQAPNLFDVNLDAIVLPFNFVPRNRPEVCIPSYSVPLGPCDPALVQNSGGGFSQYIPSGDTFTLLDVAYDFTNSEGTNIITGTAEAQTNIVGVLPDINLTDSNGATTPKPSGKDLICTPCIAPVGARLMKTGANETGGVDDGRDVDFFTLDGVNHFGSDRRFTGTTGGYYDRSTSTWKDVSGTATTRALAYPNNLTCDWSTWDNVSGYFTMYVCDDAYIIAPLATAITTTSTATIGTFTGFKIANVNEGANIQKKNLANSLGYVEMYNVAFGFSTHTTTPTTAGVNLAASTYYGTLVEANSLSSLRCVVCRTTNVSEI